MRVLVCGGRSFSDAQSLNEFLDGIHRHHHIDLLIEGGANGADAMARKFAETAGIKVKTFTADWKKHGRKAGPIRNQQMLDEGKPSIVIAFAGGVGTADMIARARSANVKVLQVTTIREDEAY